MWQQVIVRKHTGAFVRGLLHLDGCRTVNDAIRIRAIFSPNYSADILRLCGEALDMLGIEWRLSKPTDISVARRNAVARLDEFVGPKY